MEPRRIELTTVAPKEKEEKTPKQAPTLRFRLQLTETTEKSYPEFAYTELVKNALVRLEVYTEFASKFFPCYSSFT